MTLDEYDVIQRAYQLLFRRLRVLIASSRSFLVLLASSETA